MKTRKLNLELIVFAVVPIVAQIMLSFVDELLYFRLLAFIMPILICSIVAYYLYFKRFKSQGIWVVLSNCLSTYGFAFYHYFKGQMKFTEYASENNMRLDFDGFAPLMMTLIVHAIIYVALGIMVSAIFIFAKIFKQLFSPKENEEIEEYD